MTSRLNLAERKTEQRTRLAGIKVEEVGGVAAFGLAQRVFTGGYELHELPLVGEVAVVLNHGCAADSEDRRMVGQRARAVENRAMWCCDWVYQEFKEGAPLGDLGLDG